MDQRKVDVSAKNLLSLVIGGAASGKSAFAERLVLHAEKAPIYLATAQGFDDEMIQKIKRHQELRRDSGWETIEEPLDLGPHLRASGPAILLDCATVWLGNQFFAKNTIEAEVGKLVEALHNRARAITIVTNEIGQGVVPASAEARAFREAHGRMNQALAAEADLVVQITAGLPMVLKGTLPKGFA